MGQPIRHVIPYIHKYSLKLQIVVHRNVKSRTSDLNKMLAHLQQDKAASLHPVWTPRLPHCSCRLAPSCSCRRNTKWFLQLNTWWRSHQTYLMTAGALLFMVLTNQRGPGPVCILGNSQIMTDNKNDAGECRTLYLCKINNILIK